MHFIWKTVLKSPAYDETKRGKQRQGFKTTYGMVWYDGRGGRVDKRAVIYLRRVLKKRLGSPYNVRQQRESILVRIVGKAVSAYSLRKVSRGATLSVPTRVCVLPHPRQCVIRRPSSC